MKLSIKELNLLSQALDVSWLDYQSRLYNAGIYEGNAFIEKKQDEIDSLQKRIDLEIENREKEVK